MLAFSDVMAAFHVLKLCRLVLIAAMVGSYGTNGASLPVTRSKRLRRNESVRLTKS
jgi:hypothetical protein